MDTALLITRRWHVQTLLSQRWRTCLMICAVANFEFDSVLKCNKRDKHSVAMKCSIVLKGKAEIKSFRNKIVAWAFECFAKVAYLNGNNTSWLRFRWAFALKIFEASSYLRFFTWAWPVERGPLNNQINKSEAVTKIRLLKLFDLSTYSVQ